MAIYKIVNSEQLDADLKTVADAIRAKGGTSANLSFPAGMTEAIGSIEGGSGELPEGYIKPTGTLDIAENGTYDISEYQYVAVEVSGGPVIAKGTYKMNAFLYGEEYFTWESQELSGKWTEGYNGDATEVNFTSLDNDGEWCVYFKNNGTDVGTSISPSWNPDDYTSKIVIDEDQPVAESFKAWFDACFEKEQENKLAKKINNTLTELTEEDFGGVTSVPHYAFYKLTSLERVTLPNNITTIGRNAFDGCSITNINIPNSVTSIGDYAFNVCDSLTSIHIPDSVTNIGSFAVYNCRGLTNAIIGNGVKILYQNTFSSCRNLISVTIGNGVTRMDTSAFAGCKSLKSVTVKALTPPTIQSSAFSNVPDDCAFYVPAESVEAYKTATNWSARADYIFAIEDTTSTTISAGTYKMVEYLYGEEHFTWSEQELRGRHTCDFGGANNEPFTSVKNDGAFSIDYKNNGVTICEIIPSWSPDYHNAEVVIEEDQTVSEDFKVWFDACFEKI